MTQLGGEMLAMSAEGEGSIFIVRLRFQVASAADVMSAFVEPGQESPNTQRDSIGQTAHRSPYDRAAGSPGHESQVSTTMAYPSIPAGSPLASPVAPSPTLSRSRAPSASAVPPILPSLDLFGSSPAVIGTPQTPPTGSPDSTHAASAAGVSRLHLPPSELAGAGGSGRSPATSQYAASGAGVFSPFLASPSPLAPVGLVAPPSFPTHLVGDVGSAVASSTGAFAGSAVARRSQANGFGLGPLIGLTPLRTSSGSSGTTSAGGEYNQLSSTSNRSSSVSYSPMESAHTTGLVTASAAGGGAQVLAYPVTPQQQQPVGASSPGTGVTPTTTLAPFPSPASAISTPASASITASHGVPAPAARYRVLVVGQYTGDGR